MKRYSGLMAVVVLMTTLAFGIAGAVGAAGTVVVTPANTQGWTTADTRPGGAVTFVNADAPLLGGTGSLQLTTDATTTAKAQYMHAANTPLSAVTQLSYSTKQVSALFPGGDPSYQLGVCLTGVNTTTGDCNPGNPGTLKPTSFATFVFEPYENGMVVSGAWQSWDVAAGQFWSTRTVTCANGGVVNGFGGPPFYSLAQIKTMCPGAVATAYGVNIGSNNPGYTVRTDLVNFNGMTSNFELYNAPTDKDQCKDGGWQTFSPQTGAFKNQGECVSYTNHLPSHGNDD